MERIQQELEDARRIQQSLIPEKAPEIKGYDIAGKSIPAMEVSRDFYNYLLLGQNLGIVLCDVTGKSMKAAMVAALADGMLDSMIRLRDSPDNILQELNISLLPRLIRGMFVAMSLGIIYTDEKKLIFSNAGMPYPIVKQGKESRELVVNGIPLGLTGIAEYQSLSVDLEEKTVVFCSDGVIEATDKAGELYQTERLLELIQKADPDISAQEMVDLIIKDVFAFIGGEEASDDITVVVIRCER